MMLPSFIIGHCQAIKIFKLQPNSHVSKPVFNHIHNNLNHSTKR